jgi:hypothetical protein
MKLSQRIAQFWIDLPQGIRPAVLAVGAILFISLLLAVWPTSAHAAETMIARNKDGDSVRLTHNKCEITEHPAYPNGVPSIMERANVIVGGQPFAACWGVRVDGVVVLIYEDGDAGLIPITEFKPDGA